MDGALDRFEVRTFFVGGWAEHANPFCGVPAAVVPAVPAARSCGRSVPLCVGGFHEIGLLMQVPGRVELDVGGDHADVTLDSAVGRLR